MELEYLLNNIWINDHANDKYKYLNFLKLYNKKLSNIIISDDILDMISDNLKQKTMKYTIYEVYHI